MQASKSPRIPHKYFLLSTLCLLILTMSPSTVHAGNGTFNGGKFNFCVSVRFNATAAQLQQIRTAFQNASQVLSDATDGQHRFGTISIVNDSGASESAEYWINPQSGRAYATQGRYGIRGEHVMLYFPDNFQATNGADGDAYTVAHEHAHHAYGVLDEYSGPSGNAECAAPPDTANLNFCLMDNYFTRGGKSGGGSTYTLNEFCVASNHDPDADTYQEDRNHRSCWVQIGAHPKRAATAPSGLPTDAAPAGHTVTFEDGTAGLRVVLVLDHSGSMSTDNRLVLAKQGAKQFVDLLQDGDQISVVSFDDTATVNFTLTTINGSATKTAAKGSIDAISLGGNTNIGGGLQAALNQITAPTDHSCNNVVVLLSDGDHNTGTAPASVIPALQEEGVTVLSVGLGAGISASGQATLQNVANQTGGKFYRVSGGADLTALFQQLAAETTGSGLLTRSPMTLSPAQTREIQVFVEPGSETATFTLGLASSSDDIRLSLRSPSGAVIDVTNVGSNPNVETFSDPNSRVFRVRSPEPGVWTLVVNSLTVSNGRVVAQAFADHDGVQFNLSVTKDTLVFPEVVELQATPRFRGESVTGATITGFVTRPNGSSVAIALADDGSPATGDAVAGDGTYSARFNQYNGNGTYTFDVTAVVFNGRTYRGEDIFDFAASNESPVSRFQRSSNTTAVVTGVPAVSGSANLSITKTVAPNGVVAAGTELTYTLTVNNAGPDAATSVVVSDNLPLTTSFVSCASTGSGVCGGSGNNRTVTFSSLASGASATITLKTQVGASVPDGTTIENTATISSPVDDPNSSNNIVSATVTTPPLKLFQFTVSSQSVSEGAGSAEVVVTRSGDNTGAAAVDFATANGTATDKSDYTTAIGTLRFAPSEMEKRFNVLVTDDAFVEGVETLTVTLSNPSGAGLGTTSTQTLTINDNDSSASASNPIDGSEFFVRQHYFDFLNREPDPSGLAFWVSGIESCGPNAGCREVKRIHTSAAFFLSIEFQETGFFAIRFQRATFGKKSESASTRMTYRDFIRDARRLGEGVVVGQAGSDLRLEQNKQAYAEQIVTSPQFVALYPEALTGAQLVDNLFTAAVVTPTAAERQAAINAFGAGGVAGRTAAVRSVSDSASLRSAEFNSAFVLAQYFGYLRRNPTDAPDNNDVGYQFWLAKLNQFNGNFLDAEMVQAFISSVEYRQRFGS
ncbi:MAG: VWA domain-containing protein [Pyrinomonadaceae bacterium]